MFQNKLNEEHWLTIKCVFWILSFIAGINFILFLSAAHILRPYTSDDVAIQSIVQSILVDGKGRGVTGVDNFIIKLPLYIGLHHLMGNTRIQLFFTVLTCNAILFLGFISLLAYYLKVNGLDTRKNQLIAFLPVILFLGLTAAPIGDADVPGSYMNPNLRNMEIGLALWFVIFIHKILCKPIIKMNAKTLFIGIGTILCLTIFFYNDPYFIYTWGAGTILALVALWVMSQISLARLLLVVGPIVLAIALHSEVHSVHYGFLPANNLNMTSVEFTGMEHIATNVTSVLSALFKSYQANFWGQRIDHLAIFVLLLNSVLVLMFFASIGYAVYRIREGNALLQTLLLSITLLTLLAYGLTILSIDAGNFRYLFLALFTSMPLIAEMLIAFESKVAWQRATHLLIGGVCLAIIANLAFNANSIRHRVRDHLPRPNQLSVVIADEMKRRGYTKGYGEYWDANLVSFFSNREVIALPIGCMGSHHYHQYHWLVNINDFYKPADKSFLILKKGNPIFNPDNCNVNQFGPPVEIIHINDQYDLYAFNYDIGINLPS